MPTADWRDEIQFITGYLDDPSDGVRMTVGLVMGRLTGEDFGFPKRDESFNPAPTITNARLVLLHLSRREDKAASLYYGASHHLPRF